MNAQYNFRPLSKLDVPCQNLVNFNLPIKEKYSNNNSNFLELEKDKNYQNLTTKLADSPPKLLFKLESIIANVLNDVSHPVFQPLSCISPLENYKNSNSYSNINTRMLDFYINNQNNMTEYQNILSEQYIITPVNFEQVNYGQDSPLRKDEDDQGQHGLSLSLSSANSTQNITSGNEGSDSDKEKKKLEMFLKKRRRDPESFSCADIANPEVSSLPKKRKNKINRAQELFEDSFVRQTPIPQIIPQPAFNINEVYPLESFNSDLDRIKNDFAHNFMKEQFPSMYTRDNFFRHFKLLNEKRSTVLNKHSYPTGKSLQNFSIMNSLNSTGPEVNHSPRKVWQPFPETEPILGSM